MTKYTFVAALLLLVPTNFYASNSPRQNNDSNTLFGLTCCIGCLLCCQYGKSIQDHRVLYSQHKLLEAKITANTAELSNLISEIKTLSACQPAPSCAPIDQTMGELIHDSRTNPLIKLRNAITSNPKLTVASAAYQPLNVEDEKKNK